MNLEALHKKYKEQTITGRYITNNHIEPLLSNLNSYFTIGVLGNSVLGKPIHTIIVGNGKTKILIWSQMHGNESTCTKALFDMLNWLKTDTTATNTIKNNFTFYIIPILNPDGATLYTRENANKVDLNRDATNLSQPESKLLRDAFTAFKPHYCYNMHDQRTIFGVENTNGTQPATVSFLAPAFNAERAINSQRQIAMNLIVAMNDVLQKHIPEQVGRYDDSYNANCVGDYFQTLGIPTVLFEAGHYQNDYQREETRRFIFFALISGINAINENVIVVNKTKSYFDIPQNKQLFYDFVYRNINVDYESKEKIAIFASQYKEVLFENSIIFQAFIKKIDNPEIAIGHTEYDAKNGLYVGEDGNNYPIFDTKANFLIQPDRKFVNGTEIM
ncbi:M14 family metallopeptidase [Flavobacterium litorale]|uniref:Peptidase M14 n=1 Tax=Flavobacterium litorale TaxID=2856519 RepID=A0ABX8V9N7_9FLAO|nr:M14 metallopeptidase family protein [Flavobacterium litorale]QYJ67903.1 peptidase M14 [Flavobacterium litorale]